MKRLAPIPLYQQVRELLDAGVVNEALANDNRLPAESALAENLGVSRATIRETLLAMEREGLVSKRQGIGTFLHPSAVRATSRLEANPDFAQLIRNAGYAEKHTDRLYEAEVTEVPLGPLDVKRGDPLEVLERVFLADGQPVILAVASIPRAVIKGDAALLSGDAFFQILGEICGVEVTHRIAWFKARAADEKVATTLRLQPGEPVFSWDEVTYDISDRALAYSRIYFNTVLIPLCTLRTVGPNP